MNGTAVLRDVRRGEAPDELEVIDTTGAVLIVHAHGVHADEKLRTREAVLKLLAHALVVEERAPRVTS